MDHRQSGFGAPANLADWPRQGDLPACHKRKTRLRGLQGPSCCGATESRNGLQGDRDGLPIKQKRAQLRMIPGSGIWSDIRARAPWYKQDWKDGLAYGFRYA